MTVRSPWFRIALVIFVACTLLGCTPEVKEPSSSSWKKIPAKTTDPTASPAESAGSDSDTATSKTAEKATEQVTDPAHKDLPHHGVTFYTIDHYDTERDANDDLAATVKRATDEKKRILLQVGGDWCIWCKLMSEFIETDPMIRQAITDHYVLMKVTYTSDDPNEAFLSKYPAIKGYPHLFVLESDGSLLHSQDTAELESGKGYSQETFAKFLNDWKPKQ